MHARVFTVSFVTMKFSDSIWKMWTIPSIQPASKYLEPRTKTREQQGADTSASETTEESSREKQTSRLVTSVEKMKFEFGSQGTTHKIFPEWTVETVWVERYGFFSASGENTKLLKVSASSVVISFGSSCSVINPSCAARSCSFNESLYSFNCWSYYNIANCYLYLKSTRLFVFV